MFSSGMKETHNHEVTLDDISYHVFQGLLEFLYTDRFTFDPDTIWDLFEVLGNEF